MTLAYDSPERYYAVHVSTSGRVSLRWSEPMATPQDAQSYGRGQVESGNASMSFVVRVQDGRRTILEKRTTPKSAGTVIRHYLDLLDAIREGDNSSTSIIESLGLSVRSIHWLRELGIESIGQLVRRSAMELQQERGCSRMIIEEIRRKLSLAGLSLRLQDKWDNETNSLRN